MKTFSQYAKRFLLCVIKWTVFVLVFCALLYGIGIVKTLPLSSVIRAELTGIVGIIWGMTDEFFAKGILKKKKDNNTMRSVPCTRR